MTTATKAGGAVLPVDGYRLNTGHGNHLSEGLSESQKAFLWAGKPAWRELTYREPAQATIDELRAEVERLTMQTENLSAEGKLAYKVSENVGRNALQCAQDLLQKNIELRAEVTALKAKQIDVEAVMRLADGYAAKAAGAAVEILSRRLECPAVSASDAAREALRAALLGDGGTAAMKV